MLELQQNPCLVVWESRGPYHRSMMEGASHYCHFDKGEHVHVCPCGAKMPRVPVAAITEGRT